MKRILTEANHPRYRQVLQVVGLAPEPISRSNIFRAWHKLHSPKERNNYIYEIVKDLYVDGFLSFSLKLDAAPINQETVESRKGEIVFTGPEIPWDKEKKRTEVNSEGGKNWEYVLSLKGLLLYLISSKRYNEASRDKKKFTEHKQVSEKTINSVIENSRKKINKKVDLTFLQFFDVFEDIYDTKRKVGIILKVATELENLVTELTTEFLKYYIINRCYDEVIIAAGEITNSEDLSRFTRLFRNRKSSKERMEFDMESEKAPHRLITLAQSKLKVLNALIPITEFRLVEMKKDKILTEQEISS